jgi:hypothetical protein
MVGEKNQFYRMSLQLEMRKEMGLRLRLTNNDMRIFGRL